MLARRGDANAPERAGAARGDYPHPSALAEKTPRTVPPSASGVIGLLGAVDSSKDP